ncbi:MAG: serine/threonine protein kinase [Acidimicrobiia bacterium]
MGLDLVNCGTVLCSRYEITALLHSSSTIRVWEASDPILERSVIVETMDPRCTNEERSAFLDAALRNARCTHHGVVRVYDTGTHNGTTFVVSEFVRGEALDHRISRSGPMQVGTIAAVVTSVAESLAAAHAVGLIHGALRANSVLIAADDQIKISGFGAPSPDDRYRVPGEEPSAAADVYALAVIAVEMYSGEPFDPLHDDLEARLARRSDLPDRATNALRRALDPDPHSRAAHARALDRAFASLRTTPISEQRTEAVLAVTPAIASHLVEVPTAVHSVVAPATEPSVSATTAAQGEQLVSGPSPMRTALLLLIAIGIIGGLAIAFGYIVRNSKGLQFDTAPKNLVPSVVTIRSARDFDPQGDNGEENRASVARAIDGDPNTIWSTETYVSPDFGGGKSGVGLRLDVADFQSVRGVRLLSSTPGWSGAIYIADAPGASLASWGAPVASITNAGDDATLTAQRAQRGTSVLVWFTRLPAGGRLDVAEVQVLG